MCLYSTSSREQPLFNVPKGKTSSAMLGYLSDVAKNGPIIPIDTMSAPVAVDLPSAGRIIENLITVATGNSVYDILYAIDDDLVPAIWGADPDKVKLKEWQNRCGCACKGDGRLPAIPAETSQNSSLL